MTDFKIESPEDDQLNSKKHVARQIVLFVMAKDGYNVFLAIQGYETQIRGVLFTERLPLGFCKRENFDSTMAFFVSANHDTEVIIDSTANMNLTHHHHPARM